jgi:hypothetical protein
LFGCYDDAPAAQNFIAQFKNLLHSYTHQQGSQDATTFWAGCGVVRRTVFAAIGGFRRYRAGLQAARCRIHDSAVQGGQGQAPEGLDF